MVAAPVDLRTKKAEHFSPQAVQVFGPTVSTKYTNRKEITQQQYRLCLATTEYQILVGKHVLLWDQSQEIFGGSRNYNTFRRSTTANGTSCEASNPSDLLHNFGDLLQPLEFEPASRERVNDLNLSATVSAIYADK